MTRIVRSGVCLVKRYISLHKMGSDMSCVEHSEIHARV